MSHSDLVNKGTALSVMNINCTPTVVNHRLQHETKTTASSSKCIIRQRCHVDQHVISGCASEQPLIGWLKRRLEQTSRCHFHLPDYLP